MIKNYGPPIEERTMINPEDSRIVFEAKVMDSDNLLSPNSFGEFVTAIQPLTTTDYQRFFELGERCLTKVEIEKDCYSRKVATAQYENKYGMIVATQLFAPKVNIEVYHPLMLVNRDCSVNGYFRDLANGHIVFNIDYLDFYAEEEPEEEELGNDDGGMW